MKLLYVSDGAKQHSEYRYQNINLMTKKIFLLMQSSIIMIQLVHGKRETLKSQTTRASLQNKGNEGILNSV